MRTEKTRALDV